ncbi:hypothetical protein [Pseudonocardia acaciae]|uniref:hypothetical protein n=1 Tax=Pseudonocardia acaciae TaxID=551276 RepID=UPI00048F7EB6|nr:hypothetical protein [Pseudonocardia acaciae]
MGEVPTHNQFSGRADVAIQAGQIHGGVHLHGRRARLHLPGQRSRREAESAAADALADAVFDQWHRTVRDRGLFPDPIPVRWSWRGCSPTAAAGPFDPLPGIPVDDAGVVPDGTIDDLLGVFSGLRSGRAVILGGAGSGKSDAAAWMVVQALRIRDRLGHEERARFPIPILLTVTGWDHRRQSLDDWLTGELEAQHVFLRRGGMARRLLDTDRIALFLDGLDEMATEARGSALEQVDRRALHRVVIFSRTEEFDAVRAGRLRGAAELALSPVSPGDAAAYLRRCHGERAPEAWTRLLAELEERPAGVLAGALDSPLMLTLVRDAFPDPADVRVLLDPERATRQEVHGYLLDRFVDVAYRPAPGADPVSYEPASARRWLSHLAAEMTARGTYSLDWRQLPRWRPAWPRIAIASVVIMLIGGLGAALFFGPGGYAFYRTRTNNFGAIPRAAGGLMIGLWAGLVLGLAVAVASELRQPARRSRINLGAGAAVAIIVGYANSGYLFKIFGDRPLSVLVTVLAGIVAGVGAGWATARVHPPPGRGRRARWKLRYSRFPLLPGLAAGLALSFQYWFPGGVPGEPHLGEGLLNGVWGTLGACLCIGAIRPHSGARAAVGWGSDWKREIRRALAYGTLFGVVLGLGFGLREIFMWIPAGEGPKWDNVMPALWQAVGIAIPFGVGFGLTICDSWIVSLLFVQLRRRRVFPLLGMRFLDDAYRRRILRAEGPRLQFRHALLHDTLAAEARPARAHEPVRKIAARGRAVAAAGAGLWLLWLVTDGVFTSSGSAQLWAARAGDNAPAGTCIATEDSWNANKYTVLTADCDQPHWGEVLGYPTLGATPSPNPGDAQVLAVAKRECGRLRQQHRVPGKYSVVFLRPHGDAWNTGTKQTENYATCVVHGTDDRSMTTKVSRQ